MTLTSTINVRSIKYCRREEDNFRNIKMIFERLAKGYVRAPCFSASSSAASRSWTGLRQNSNVAFGFVYDSTFVKGRAAFFGIQSRSVASSTSCGSFDNRKASHDSLYMTGYTWGGLDYGMWEHHGADAWF